VWGRLLPLHIPGGHPSHAVSYTFTDFPRIEKLIVWQLVVAWDEIILDSNASFLILHYELPRSLKDILHDLPISLGDYLKNVPFK
jgi:hypothetical protein